MLLADFLHFNKHIFLLFAGSCEVPGILPIYRKSCDNRPFCFVYAHADPDPCPTVSKYLEMTYTCEQKGVFPA